MQLMIAWTANVTSEPPAAVGAVRQSRYIHGLTKEHKAVVINIPQARNCGNWSSGVRYRGRKPTS